MNKVKPWIAFVILNIITWLGYSYIYENTDSRNMQKIYTYPCHFLCLAIITIIGFWGLGGYQKRWVKKIWLLIYFVLISLLLLFGVISLCIPGVHFKLIKKGAAGLFYFFITPGPFIAVYVFSLTMKERPEQKYIE